MAGMMAKRQSMAIEVYEGGRMPDAGLPALVAQSAEKTPNGL